MRGSLIARDHVAGRQAAALVVDGVLEDLLIDAPASAGPAPGAILRGRAARPLKGQGGVIVALPEGASGFLRGARGIAPGAAVVVQVSGWAEPGKAAPLRLRLALRGPLVVATPGAPGVNAARGLPGDLRDRLVAEAEAVLSGLALDPVPGLVLRSAAADAAPADVAAEIAGLAGRAARLAREEAGAPALLVPAPGAHESAAMDWPHPDAEDDAPGAFARHGIDAMIAEVAGPRVALPAGASMIVEATSALVAVDVNTGGDHSPAAGLKANLAAARALPRALRLRGLGGQVVVDFAPMPRQNRDAVAQAIARGFRDDRTETQMVGWTGLGLCELQRSRGRLPLSRALEGWAGRDGWT
ncbi:MAG: ribonuclease E/G [Rhodobacteraceae bacterium]|nr:ribonuclease E/G [Paracoccaceae bacterium]